MARTTSPAPSSMTELLVLAGLVAAYIAAMRWVLPRFGIRG